MSPQNPYLIPLILIAKNPTGRLKNTYHKIGAAAHKNGNLTADGYRSITGITYNYLNLPAKITYDATKYIELTYDASGRKWKKTVVDRITTTTRSATTLR